MSESLLSAARRGKTTLVTVTYGDRLSYLEELLTRVFTSHGVSRAVVVSNAAAEGLEAMVQCWGDKVRVVRLATNTGSANGYSVGISAALDDGADFIWLMDDDNAPMAGALRILHDRLQELAVLCGSGLSAVAGFRPDHQSDIAAGVPAKRAIPPRSSFFGFHASQIPFKIWRRLGRSASVPPRIASSIVVPFAAYGGLLASRELFERIGLPRCELVLYADDTEYTHRITAAGGRIELVTTALLEDLECSWNTKARFSNAFRGFLEGGSDLRAYYSSRNQAWFDKNRWSGSKFMYSLNRALYIALLKYFAVRTNRGDRYRLLREAIRDGETSSLGINKKIPL